jgi:hypothetical protein
MIKKNNGCGRRSRSGVAATKCSSSCSSRLRKAYVAASPRCSSHLARARQSVATASTSTIDQEAKLFSEILAGRQDFDRL